MPAGAVTALELAWTRYYRVRASGAAHKTDVGVSALRVHIACATGWEGGDEFRAGNPPNPPLTKGGRGDLRRYPKAQDFQIRCNFFFQRGKIIADTLHSRATVPDRILRHHTVQW